MTLETPTLLNNALDYLKKDLTVIPIRGWLYAKNYDDSKRPLIATWREWQDKKPTETIVRGWFDQKPNINIGLLTGPHYGLLVLDIDRQHGGYTSIQGKELPPTWVSMTKNGEQHFYKWDNRLKDVSTTLVKLMPGIDVRGKGGYVVAVPSKVYGEENLRYTWRPSHSPDDRELANPPEWFVEMLLERGAKDPETEFSNTPNLANTWFETVKNGVAEGENRHRAMTQLASFYMSRGLPEDDIILLMTTWNQKCQPPKEENEFLKKLDGFLENWRTGRYRSTYKPPVNKFISQSSSDFMNSGEAKIDWLVDGLIPMQSIGFLHGYGGLGKSWATLDLAIEIGRGGGKWLHEFPTNKGSVLYIDEESNPALLRYRYNKLLNGKGLTPDKVNVNFVSLQGLKLDDLNCVDAFKGLLVELHPSLVIYDPFVSCHSSNENSSGDMAKIRGVLKSLSSDCACSFLFIDHENKPSMTLQTAAQRQRGSSEKDALADYKLGLSKDEKGLLVEHSKTRWGLTHPPFGLEIVDLGSNKTFVRSVGSRENA
jgi:hypothetical protein